MRYQVFEDSAGQLFLFVFDGEGCMVYANARYECIPGILRKRVEKLTQEGISTIESWEDSSDAWDDRTTPANTYERLFRWATDGFDGLPWAQIIVDQNGIYPERMGTAGKLEFIQSLFRPGDDVAGPDWQDVADIVGPPGAVNPGI
jgi:DNA phosphorothioation-dependent restriction protein DptG